MGYKDPAQQRAYQLRWTLKRRSEWIEANGPCQACGATEHLEVDHIDPTQKVTHLVWTWSAVRREAELEKCQVLCRECHQRKTAEQLRTIPPHGTYARYSRHDDSRCRCDECRRAAADYERNRRRQRRCAGLI